MKPLHNLSHRRRLGDNITTFRKEQGLTQTALAEKIDAHWTYISRIERGCVNLPIDTLVRICKALNCPPSQLL